MTEHSHNWRWRVPTWSLVLPALLCMVLPPNVRAGEFPLTVNDVSGLTTPWPLVASLAFPEGEITDASAIRVVSAESEVPAQIDVTATWRDGSIRWALAGFTASPAAEYRVEYGAGVKRTPHPAPLHVTRDAGGRLLVDTGPASYEFLPDKLLPERAWLQTGSGRTPILSDSGAGAYLVDNRGRTARVAGAAAEVTSRVLKEGPGRFVVQRTGWYVTAQDERLARAAVWLYFAAGSANLRVTHSLILTEDTNKLWIRDYGLELRTPAPPERVVCALGQPGKEDLKAVATEGGEVFMLQDTYPHFAERESRAIIGRTSGGEETVLEEVPAAGDWAHGDYAGYGLTLVMPWLAERFPKAISFGPRGARAVLWSGRSGRELDFRVKTLVEEYFQTWAKEGPWKAGAGDLESLRSNAQGAARTHDIWFLPRGGGYDEKSVKTTATAAARLPLALADPVWLCATESIGSPMLHKDTTRFPREEALISECWDRLILPLRAFPMKGFIAWGCYPDRSYSGRKGRVVSNFIALTDLREYGLRRAPWRLYARSGERRYYEYGHRWSRFTGDWFLAHNDVPGSPGKKRGAFTKKPAGGLSARDGNLPLFWGTRTSACIANGNIGHWLLDYYLTGDERSLELLKMVKERFKRSGWRFGEPVYALVGLRLILTLSIMDWDEDACRMARETGRELLDLDIQNGLKSKMYKDIRAGHNILEYYLETGDELAREAFLKVVDQRYRFDRGTAVVGYMNYGGFMYSMAYWMTGDERYRRVAEQTIREQLYYAQSLPLSADLGRKPKDPLDWKHPYVATQFPGPRRSFYMGHWEWHNPFIGMPTVLKLLAEKGWSGKVTPLVVKPMEVVSGKVLFPHETGRPTTINLYFRRLSQPNTKLTVSAYPDSPGANSVPRIEVEIEQRMSVRQYFLDRPELYPNPNDHYHARVTVPAETPGGLYLLSLGGNQTFTVLDATAKKVALYCPEGFWSVCVGDHAGSQSYGRSGQGMPMFFKVPGNLEQLEIFLGRPVRVRAPDGSVAVEMSDENIGKMAIPVKGRGGIWSIEPYIAAFRGTSPPSFVRLLNVEPVVAFGSPGNLPEGTTGKPADLPAPLLEPTAPPEFVSGVAGKAVRLSGKRSLSFTKGGHLKQGGYTYFPGATGTVEFWFRPDMATHEMPKKMNESVGFLFLHGPHLVLDHRYGGQGRRNRVWSTLRLQLVTEKEKGAQPAGMEWGHFVRGGQWAHIAYTWEVREGSKGTESDFAVFLDGRPLRRERVPYGLKPVSGRGKVRLSEAGDEIVVGPFGGTMDMLRLSDVIRYRKEFSPTETAPNMDKHTRALFLFDGNLQGTSAFSEASIEAH